MAPHPTPRRLAIAAVLALGTVGLTVPMASSPTPAEASPAPNVNARSAPPNASTSTESPAPAAVRSLLTQAAILKRAAYRDRFRRGRARGAWVPVKVGGRLTYYHKQ